VLDKSNAQSVDKLIQSFLTSLGLTAEESFVFCSLLSDGSQTPLQLSQKTKIPRTTVYRTLQSLKDKHLLPASTRQLERFVEFKTIEIKNLRAQLPTVLQLLESKIAN
jgi:sugar-specific transcriptional regulator TrmB